MPRTRSMAPQGRVTLVVAEKPSVARDLARVLGARRRSQGAYLGEGLWVTWCVGHVAELCEPEHYHRAWRRWHKNQLPMVPERFALRPASHTQEHWGTLARLLTHRDVAEVVNACDAGREGELIFRYAMELAQSHKPVRRLWLAALTDNGIRHAYARLRESREFDALAAAARCRAEADWLMGLNGTRALTLRVREQRGGRELFTVGRVQTPTLAMLVAREEAIERFVPEPFHLVEAHFEGPAGKWTARYEAPAPAAKKPQQPRAKNSGSMAPERRRPERIVAKERAEEIATAARTTPLARVVTQQRRIEEELPPYLYDLTSLQRRANARFGLGAAATLEAAQGLYERHKALTYPRTDSNFLPSALAPGLGQLLQRLTQGPLAQEARWAAEAHQRAGSAGLKRIVRDAEVSDHHAIVPTGRLVEPALLTAAEQQIFELVTRRTLAVFLPPARLGHDVLTLSLGGHRFVARGRSVVEPGWYTIEPPPRAVSSVSHLPALDVGATLAPERVDVLARKTEPPPRLSEAALLGLMERPTLPAGEDSRSLRSKAEGLGTPATRATIIENLKRRGFVEREGRVLKPTAQGRRLLEELSDETLKSAALTGEWEGKLALVAAGKLSRARFMQEVEQLVRSTVGNLLATNDQAQQQTL